MPQHKQAHDDDIDDSTVLDARRRSALENKKNLEFYPEKSDRSRVRKAEASNMMLPSEFEGS